MYNRTGLHWYPLRRCLGHSVKFAMCRNIRSSKILMGVPDHLKEIYMLRNRMFQVQIHLSDGTPLSSMSEDIPAFMLLEGIELESSI